jgi:hypothetical protein
MKKIKDIEFCVKLFGFNRRDQKNPGTCMDAASDLKITQGGKYNADSSK